MQQSLLDPGCFHLPAPPSLTCRSLSSCLPPHGLNMAAGPPRLTSILQDKVKSAHLYQSGGENKIFLEATPTDLCFCASGKHWFIPNVYFPLFFITRTVTLFRKAVCLFRKAVCPLKHVHISSFSPSPSNALLSVSCSLCLLVCYICLFYSLDSTYK